MKKLTKIRDRLLILIDVLRALQIEQGKYISNGILIPEDRGLRLTDLMYEVNINPNSLEKIGEFAKERGLIEIKNVGRHKLHYLTKKGYETVTSFNEWDVDHDINPTSIYTLSRSPGGSIILYRDRNNIRATIARKT